ncbi:GAG-pre-integrase domain [Arabidopsis thaliana x Arabidopsis arenosa]|uniref:GAG-pre-integrase domain n=1 Tax=Arabidopsis thaliana x Arabidopsis arenosa TaxID=1240361 RepID=A0A8T1XSG8_9BRAS|nr:GAG-pre-integrase domain [Arabidopsis thaliana x Arabidopsis arenosa]
MGEKSEKFVQPAIPRFDGYYDFWSMTMENFLRSRELWSLVEDGIPTMAVGTSPASEMQRKSVEEAKLKDLKVKNFLFQAIDREILETILDKSTSKAIWESMRKKYQGSTKVKRAQLQALRKEFELLVMKEGEKVDSFLGRTLAVVNKMKSNGEIMEQSTIVSKILRSLTSKFNYVVCSIEESNDLSTLSIDELHGSLLVHEGRIWGQQEEEQALKVSQDERTGRGRGRGGFRGGRGRGRGGRTVMNKALVECFKCHTLGHFQYECPEWERKVNYAELEGDEEVLLMAYLELSKTNREDVWFLDSGCSNHMTGNKEWFCNMEGDLNKTVKLGNDMTLSVVAKGSVRVQVDGITQVISDVYYVPELRNNLLSMGQLQEKGLAILIQDGTCKVFHPDKGVIMQTSMSGNRMFYLFASKATKNFMCLQTEEIMEKEAHLWHCRFGHLNHDGIKMLAHKNMVIGLPALKNTKEKCQTCIIGKQGAGIDSGESPNGGSSTHALPVARASPQPQPQPIPQPTVRASMRERRTPTYLADYEVGEENDPTRFEDAEKQKIWREAMMSEIESIEKNQTWELMALPEGVKPIGVKWVYKTKLNEDGEVEKYKARLVAKGYAQSYGIDYTEVFAPVARLDTVRTILAVAAQSSWEVFQLDVKSAFLHGELKEDVYVNQPEGFVKKGEEEKVYKLKKALYGLKQAPRAWYNMIEAYFLRENFERCPSEHTLFTKSKEGKFIIVSLYVDDLIFTGNDRSFCDEFKSSMMLEFEMSDLGKMKYFLGVEVKQCQDGIFICQRRYAREVLARFGMENSNSVKNPIVPGTKLHKDQSGERVDETLFKQLVGSLMYLTVTRPDLMFVVCLISRFMASPRVSHWLAAKRILRYLKGTTELGVFYKRGESNMKLVGYTDSDYAGDLDDRKSTSGYVFMMASGAVSWASKKQSVVALSTTEAEYIAAAACVCQCVWLRRVLEKVGFAEDEETVIMCDNSSAIQLSKHPVFHGKSKHIDVRFHYLRELVNDGVVKLCHCPTEDQIADIFTKPLKLEQFLKLRKMLGVIDLSEFNISHRLSEEGTSRGMDFGLTKLVEVLKELKDVCATTTRQIQRWLVVP